jgi:hypothetical protein
MMRRHRSIGGAAAASSTCAASAAMLPWTRPSSLAVASAGPRRLSAVTVVSRRFIEAAGRSSPAGGTHLQHHPIRMDAERIARAPGSPCKTG